MVGRPILAKAIRQLRNGPVGRTQIGFSAAWTMLPMRASLAMSDLPDHDMMDAPVHAIDDEAYAVAQFAHGRLQPPAPLPGQAHNAQASGAGRCGAFGRNQRGPGRRIVSGAPLYSAILRNVRTLSRATAASSCRRSHLELAAGCLSLAQQALKAHACRDT
jgi:hypothetical protein